MQLRALSCFAVVCLSIGCASNTDDPESNTGPVIDSLQIEDPVVKVGANYKIKGNISFHDAENDNVASWRMSMNGVALPTQGFGAALSRANGVPFELTLMGAPPGTFDVSVTLVDARGAEGVAAKTRVTLP